MGRHILNFFFFFFWGGGGWKGGWKEPIRVLKVEADKHIELEVVTLQIVSTSIFKNHTE